MTYEINQAHKELELEAFTDVLFIIEANSNEQHNLWRDWHHAPIDGKPVPWKQIMSGFSMVIDHCKIDNDELPINVSFSFAYVNNIKVCFYDVVSDLVIHSKVRKFLERIHIVKYDCGTRWAHTDASNFHNCVGFCKSEEAMQMNLEMRELKANGTIRKDARYI